MCVFLYVCLFCVRRDDGGFGIVGEGGLDRTYIRRDGPVGWVVIDDRCRRDERSVSS